MHVVQALAALSVGGSELVTTEISASLSSQGHRVTVLGAHGPLAGPIKAGGAEWLDWPMGRKRLSTLRYIGRLAAWLERERPDIVHAHSRLPAWICYRALQKLPAQRRPAFVTTMHGQYTVSPYSAIMARGDRVIAVSRHIRDYTLANYSWVPSDRVVVIHGGVSKAAFPYAYQPPAEWFEQTYAEFPALRDKRLLLLPARLSRYKGHPAFIELLARLAPEFETIHGVIVGPGRPGSRYRAELEGLAERSGVINRISFTGLRTDMREWMAAAELVFNLCSDPPEAFGRTVPEALHLGVPVVAWDHGGVSETLAEMFPAGAVRANQLSGLLNKTREFLLQRPFVPESQAFLLEHSMQDTLRLYCDVLEEKACSS
jgi:glycosyltransferase involved in cell wall biosynthesis